MIHIERASASQYIGAMTLATTRSRKSPSDRVADLRRLGSDVPIAAIGIKTIGDARAPPTVSGLRGIAPEDQPTL